MVGYKITQKSIVFLVHNNNKKNPIKYLGTNFTKIVQIYIKGFFVYLTHKRPKYMKSYVPE